MKINLSDGKNSYLFYGLMQIPKAFYFNEEYFEFQQFYPYQYSYEDKMGSNHIIKYGRKIRGKI